MQSVTIQADITVKCEKCNAELSAQYDTRRAILDVTPCERCLETAHDEGRSEGLVEGREENEP